MKSSKNVENNSRYMKLIEVAENQMKWWEKAKAGFLKHICFVSLSQRYICTCLQQMIHFSRLLELD